MIYEDIISELLMTEFNIFSFFVAAGMDLIYLSN
jgi:hypothetical protein